MKLARRDLLRSLLAGIGSAAVLGTTSSASALTPGQLETGKPDAGVAPLTSGISAGTASVFNVNECINEYRKAFNYVVHWRGKVMVSQAAMWGAPGVAGHPSAVVGPKDMQRGLIRFVEVSTRPTKAFTTRGWTALEIRTRNVDELARHLEGSSFRRIGGPADLKFTTQSHVLRAVQALGPSGEALYCTQSLVDPEGAYPGGQLGPNNVGTLFIMVLACWPYLETRDFYVQTLGMKLGVEHPRPLRFANQFIGWPDDRNGILATARSGPTSLIELDGYPEAVPSRPIPGGNLPAGASMCTLEVPNLGAVAAALKTAEIPFSQMESRLSQPPYRGSAALACSGRSGEIVEFVQSNEAPTRT
ncbi:MAG TPA: VOC family protein [Candidatus Dormibacteraeota bacterium]|nr:VOC family protein [Candidatus Dormibacteraeota bacterium]